MMSCMWRRSGPAFSAGSRALTAIARGQSVLPPKMEQIIQVRNVFMAQNIPGISATFFCRPFSLGTERLTLNYEMPQSMSNGSESEETQVNADLEKCLGGLLSETTFTLMHEAIRNMSLSKARGILKLASTSTEVPKVVRYLHNLLFRIFVEANRLDRAVEILEEMKKSSIPINMKSFSSLALSYVKAGMKAEAEETLDFVKSFAVTNNQGVFRVLLREYLLSKDEEGISRLLKRCSESQSFNSALKVLAEMGKAEEILKLLNRMEAADMCPNKGAVFQVTQCLCNAKMIDEAQKYMKKFYEKGLLPNIRLSNILVGALIGENRLDDALQLVYDLKDIGCKPNANTHHYLISGYLESGQTDKALLQLEEMKVDGCKPSLGTAKLFDGILNTTEYAELLGEATDADEGTVARAAARILEICEGRSWNSDIEEALSQSHGDLSSKLVKKVLQKIELTNIRDFFAWAGKQQDYSHGRHEYRALIRRYLKAGLLDNATQSFEDMWEENVQVLPIDFAHLVYYSGKAGNVTKTKEAMRMMKCFGYSADGELFDAALRGHAEANDDEGVDSILQDLTNADEFNAGISALARGGKPDYALRMLEVMEQKGYHANLKTYGLLVKCLCNAKRTDEALEALENMEGKGLVPDINIFNTLISHCCQHEKLDKATELFSHMKETGCQPNILTHNSLISGYLRSGQVDKANQHLDLMKAEGCSPTRETSRLFVIHFSNREELEEALQEFEKTAEPGKFLSADACNCLLNGLIKAGKLDTAWKVYEKMKIFADITTFAIMLRGCCNLSKFDLIEELLAEIRMRKMQLPISLYVVLLQTYSRANISKKVASTFQELQNSGQSIDRARTNSAVLDSLSRVCQLDTGVKFCNNLVEHGGKINSRQVKHFLRLLVRLGRAGEAAELSKELYDKGCIVPEKSEALIT